MSTHAPVRTIPDQTGRTWLVTGATNGIGREVARSAAAAGARIIVPGRAPERVSALADELRALGGDPVTGALDLADLASVRRFAASVDEPVDVLVDNAGAASPRRRETADGFELVLGTNFLGPFALTNLLADRVRERIVIVGSDAHRGARIDGADPHFRHRRWTFPAAYGQSKLADMLWARALQSRLDARASGVRVELAHPGWALTNIQNVTGAAALDRVVTAVTALVAQSAHAGAWPVLQAAVSDLPPLTYLGPDGAGHLRGRPSSQETSALARDDDAAEAVWALGVRETGTDLRPRASEPTDGRAAG
ncbi:SDR family NAD(P)-dependent oxidoreductase [Pseudoclavibacter chungangensis]|uniref:SDR family NAD(P)-dependent oxidoreductase n=1 Tax=Pseudoclavibacter chungangensis TaxID=587635 RepID=A0A7J5BMJ0_9MICO|nr:SDR family NAD(P)-dependent oxidoreductase [Pseudoclavibacter chungangensis]KAB1652485.1 SDR family NAD(P)-dependent oxidoreductase [Pseudoclavibacter chungangensis]NYJ66072.1 NAD(P)-dependent dehydrogenase (short-subunit alcohol dehydrogenase family) [Pseudoclavibacter chungangensis]